MLPVVPVVVVVVVVTAKHLCSSFLLSVLQLQRVLLSLSFGLPGVQKLRMSLCTVRQVWCRVCMHDRGVLKMRLQARV